MTLSVTPRPAAFVLAATQHGTMIVNRFDTFDDPNDPGNPRFGVGHDLLNRGSCAPTEINLSMDILSLLRQERGDGVVGIDCGANIGTFAISWAIHMTEWGTVLAFEPQRLLYYALCGNTVLNNCRNLRVETAAVGSEVGILSVPVLDYYSPASFGSLELRQSATNQPIGQPVDYDNTYGVSLISIDALQLDRVDLIKIDVEGMEMEVLEGAQQTIANQHPLMIIEWNKCGIDKLSPKLTNMGYKYLNFGPMTIIAFHRDDPVRGFIQVK
jgi:FkbM family methyltransferase